MRGSSTIETTRAPGPADSQALSSPGTTVLPRLVSEYFWHPRAQILSGRAITASGSASAKSVPRSSQGMALPDELGLLRIGTDCKRQEDRHDDRAAEQRVPDLCGDGGAVHEVTQRRDDQRDGVE